MADYSGDNLPRRCKYRGKIARVLSYEGNDNFRILMPDDSVVLVKRSAVVFLRGKSK